MEIELRDMRASDAREIAEIEKHTFSLPWSESSLAALSCAPNAIARVAESGGRVVGYYSLYRSFDEGDVNNIAVTEDMRGQGIGNALMRDMLEQCGQAGIDRLFLEVRASNKTARALYEKFSFKQYSLRKKYYDGEEDAVMYVR